MKKKPEYEKEKKKQYKTLTLYMENSRLVVRDYEVPFDIFGFKRS